jgi:hypothetical protein
VSPAVPGGPSRARKRAVFSLSLKAPAFEALGDVTCSECQTHADLWDVVLARAVVQPPFSMCLVGLGATRTDFRRDIEADKYHEIQLADVGIPTDATVLQVG